MSDDFAVVRERYERPDVRVPPRVHALATVTGPQLVEVPALVDSV
jgi:hypothetical protein